MLIISTITNVVVLVDLKKNVFVTYIHFAGSVNFYIVQLVF